MHIVRYQTGSAQPRIGIPRIGILSDGNLADLPVSSTAELLRLTRAQLQEIVAVGESAPVGADVQFLPPIDGATEVWAAGVTYHRSRQARIEESSQQSVYELVYDADRPELFFKSAAWRVVTDGADVAIRADSTWNVPEPELALVINRHGEVVGYLACNDMSSRSIEGINPLYLPQAKIYAGACALSYGIRPAWEVDAADVQISMAIARHGNIIWQEATSTQSLHRTYDDLVHYLYLAENFPDGAVLSTGTGIVPAADFTLEVGDVVTITVDQVGVLENTVVSGRESFQHQSPGSASTIAESRS